MRLEEILEKLYEEGSFEGEHRAIHPDRIAETKQAILSWFKEQLPKEKKIVGYLQHIGFQHPSDEEKEREDIGYNKCLKDILNKLDKELL